MDQAEQDKITRAAAKYWDVYCYAYGLSKAWLGKEFRSDRGSIMVILGVEPRARKYKILCRKIQNGRLYRVEPRTIIEQGEAINLSIGVADPVQITPTQTPPPAQKTNAFGKILVLEGADW